MPSHPLYKVLPKSRGVGIMLFSLQKLYISLRVLVEQQGILNEKLGSLLTGFTLDISWVSRMEDLHITSKRDLPIRQSTPSNIGVLSKMWGIRLTRDSWDTIVITQKCPGGPSLEGHGFRGLKPLWHILSRLKWIPHSAILTLPVASVDSAQTLDPKCRYTWHSEAPTSGCCSPHTTRPPSASTGHDR